MSKLHLTYEFNRVLKKVIWDQQEVREVEKFWSDLIISVKEEITFLYVDKAAKYLEENYPLTSISRFALTRDFPPIVIALHVPNDKDDRGLFMDMNKAYFMEKLKIGIPEVPISKVIYPENEAIRFTDFTSNTLVRLIAHIEGSLIHHITRIILSTVYELEELNQLKILPSIPDEGTPLPSLDVGGLLFNRALTKDGVCVAFADCNYDT